MAAHQGRPIRHKAMACGLIQLMASVHPLMRKVLEMRYLWDHPHRLDDVRLREILPDVHITPVAQVMAAVLPRPVARGAVARPA